MHSNGMRTVRLLIISKHPLRKGVSAWGDVCHGGVSAQGVSAGGGCIPACNGADTPPPVDRQTPVKT